MVFRQDLLSLLTQLDECLGRSDVARLKFLCSDIVPKAKLENVTRGLHLMQELCKLDRLGPDNRILLNQLLYKIGRYDLLRTLGMQKTVVERTFGSPHGIPSSR